MLPEAVYRKGLLSFILYTLLLLLGVLVGSQFQLVIGWSLHAWVTLSFGLLFASLLYVRMESKNLLPFLRVGPCVGGVFVLLGLISSCVLNPTSDSVTDHVPTVHHLAKGWNPIYDPLVEKVELEPSFYVQTEADYGVSVGKLPHYWGALAYGLSGQIESCKILNFVIPWLLGMGALLLSVDLRLSMVQTISFVLLNALCPLAVQQVATSYVDSPLLAFLLLLVYFSFLWLKNRELPFLWGGLIAFLLLPHAKLTGLPLSLLFGIVLLWTSLRYAGPARNWALSTVGLYLLLLSHPYVSNYATFGSAVYPFPRSADDARFIAASREVNPCYQKPPLTALWSTLTSRTRLDCVFNSKLPWEANAVEFLYSGYQDSRIAGFGPWFGLATLLTSGILLLLLFSSFRASVPAFLWFTVVLAIGSTLVAPVQYWLRYIPQIYLVPCLGTLMLFLAGMKSAFFRKLSWVVCGVMIANSMFVTAAVFRLNALASSELNAAIKDLQKSEQKLTIAAELNFHGLHILFREKGLKVHWVKQCKEPRLKLSSITVCADL